jgi:hypothetical protein
MTTRLLSTSRYAQLVSARSTFITFMRSTVHVLTAYVNQLLRDSGPKIPVCWNFHTNACLTSSVLPRIFIRKQVQGSLVNMLVPQLDSEEKKGWYCWNQTVLYVLITSFDHLAHARSVSQSPLRAAQLQDTREKQREELSKR